MFSHDKRSGAVVCLADYGRIKRGAVVPAANELYSDVEDWMAAGNELAPFDGYPDTRTPEEVEAQTREALTGVVQNHLDETARERNYDGILSLCTYATSANAKFKAEGQAGVEWRDEVWAACYAVLDDVLAGNRAVPTDDELLAELPAFSWPQ